MKNRAENRGGRGVWVFTRPVLQRRSRGRYAWAGCEAGVRDMDVRQAYHAFQTMRRWHEHGHAGRVAEIMQSFRTGGFEIGRIEGFTFIKSGEEAATP